MWVTAAAATGALVLGLLAPSPAQAELRRIAPPLTTPWTADVSTRTPLPEHPRPQLRRAAWRTLNGQWQFATARDGERPPVGRRLRETILVPYPVQSPLSGIGRSEQGAWWYRRSFTIPRAWRGRRVLLHFGAVTHAATVWVNGRRLGTHRGSYDAFHHDVTRHLRRGRANELVVRAEDPGVYAGGQPLGKQSTVPISVVHTASSGIWQTVWLEAVGRTHVERLDHTPDPRRERLRVRPRIGGPRRGARVVLTARRGGRVVGRASAPAGRSLSVPVPDPRLWSPDDPFLYDLDVEVRRGDRVVDRARSYFGMRTIEVRRVRGVPRMLLNGRPLFQTGTLDQGFWPDGIYTAPTDAALSFDLRLHRRAGFNMVRKHVKVEPQRWYYHADRLGLLVWQDMPNMSIYRPVSEADERQFERELREMVDEHRSSPAVIGWVPFNEGWGEFDVERVVRSVERRDPSRLVNGHSGAANCCLATEPRGGDIRDTHLYNGPYAPRPDHRAGMIGELGFCEGRAPRNQYVPPRNNPLPGLARPATSGFLRQVFASLRQQVRTPGLSGAVFTQLTAVEQELGGLVSYDRRVEQCDVGLLRTLNRQLIAAGSGDADMRPQPGAVPAGAAAAWDFDGGPGDLRLEGPARIAGGVLEMGGPGARAVAPGPVVGGGDSLTLSAWVRHDDDTQTAPAVSQGRELSLGLLTSNERPDLDLLFTSRGLPLPRPDWRFSLRAGPVRANGGYSDLRENPVAGRWYHVVGTVDRATRTAAIFVDGEPVDTRTVEVPLDVDGPLALGDGFRGAVDRVRVYRRALSPEEVWRLHAAERG